MAGGSLLLLLDDIAAVLDDVALMTKVAAKKTAGVLGDDLALNAEQVSGVRAERELPVVWSVAKGSFINKLILVPLALLISIFANFLILPLLMIGGAYLCFEGAEKVLHKFLHRNSKHLSIEHHSDDIPQIDQDIVSYENAKIKGAIRTDFILSAEIIVIALGSIPDGSSLLTRVGVLSLIAIIMTIGVYGLVACIVKLDDIGFFLIKKNKKETIFHAVGMGLVTLAPKLMHFLAFVGTLAMFTVGGSILAHGFPFMNNIMNLLVDIPFKSILSILIEMFLGLIAGGLLVSFATLYQKLFMSAKMS